MNCYIDYQDCSSLTYIYIKLLFNEYLMRLYSHNETAKITLSIIAITMIIILLLVVTNVSLSCIDQNNCLRPFCQISWLTTDYSGLISSNC